MRKDIKAFLKLALSTKGDGPCLEWPFATTGNGYSYIKLGRKGYGVHRIICELVYGPPTILKHDCAHSCHNKRCVRPGHLRWATASENVNESNAK